MVFILFLRLVLILVKAFLVAVIINLLIYWLVGAVYAIVIYLYLRVQFIGVSTYAVDIQDKHFLAASFCDDKYVI